MAKPRHLRYAVLTGDLIGSTGFEAAASQQAIDTISHMALDHAKFVADIAPRFTRFRGDGWQFVLANVPFALALALRIQASLAGQPNLPNTRISIGMGRIDTFGAHDLSTANGEAFLASGRGLDWLEQHGGMISLQGHGLSRYHQIIAELLALRLRQWTPPQAEAAALLMAGKLRTGREIAQHLGISEQAVSYRLAGADARKVLAVLDDYRAEFLQEFPDG